MREQLRAEPNKEQILPNVQLERKGGYYKLTDSFGNVQENPVEQIEGCVLDAYNRLRPEEKREVDKNVDKSLAGTIPEKFQEEELRLKDELAKEMIKQRN